MTEIPRENVQAFDQASFDQTTAIVSQEFKVEQAVLQDSIPTYNLAPSQETKKAFLRLLGKLEQKNLIAILRNENGPVLRVVQKPPVRKSNILINWILFLATIGTTFAAGYFFSAGITDPLVGGLMFSAALMTILGLHELGHKLTANRKGMEATSPYFIPGPPAFGGLFSIGTFGAVIMQKSLPPNRDSLFDVGSSGPVTSFILAVIATAVGLLLSPIQFSNVQLTGLPVPLIFRFLADALIHVPPSPADQPYAYIMLHPVAIAGWAGLVVTMLNLLPAAMLDGGHVSRSLFGERARTVLTVLAIAFLIVQGFWPMAFFVIFLSMYKHPGPLDDFSPLSTSRKLFTVFLVAVLILSSFPLLGLY